MKLLLHKDIPNLGYLGDVVEVADGYGRNYLLPQGLAVVPTEANVKAIQEERARKAEIRRLERENLVKVAEHINGAEVSIRARANDIGHLFGSVTEETIGSALREKGYEAQNKHIQLNEHIRQLGTQEVKLRFAEDLSATVTVHIIRPEDEEDGSQGEKQETESAAE